MTENDRPASRRVETWGLADQALVSATNFLTIVVVARALAAEEFGYFVLAFTILQSCGMLQAALLARAHNVLGAVRSGRDYADYSTTAALSQVGLAIILAALALVVAALLEARGVAQAALVAALAPALLTWQLQELGRRMLYTERRLAAAFANDVVGYGGQAVALVLLALAGELTAVRALVTLSLSFGLATALVVWQLGPTLRGRPNRASARENWHFGKWLGAAEVGQWIATHFTIFVAAIVVGPVASAALKAGQTLLGPMSVLLTFVTSYLPTDFARELRELGTVDRSARRALGRVLPVVVPYCLVIGLLAGPVLELVYGSEYRSYEEVVVAFSLYYAALAFSTVAIATLTARSLTRRIFVGQTAGAVVSLAMTWLLLRELGAVGGVVGMLLGLAAAMAVFLPPLGRRALLPLLGSRSGL